MDKKRQETSKSKIVNRPFPLSTKYAWNSITWLLVQSGGSWREQPGESSLALPPLNVCVATYLAVCSVRLWAASKEPGYWTPTASTPWPMHCTDSLHAPHSQSWTTDSQATRTRTFRGDYKTHQAALFTICQTNKWLETLSPYPDLTPERSGQKTHSFHHRLARTSLFTVV